MSKGFQRQGINISFETSGTTIQLEEQQQHQQSRRDKLSVQGFEPPPEPGAMPVFETGGMWSDMFNFQSAGGGASTEFMDNQISQSSNYRMQREGETSVAANEWYGNRAVMGPLGDSRQPSSNNRDSIAQNHQISRLNADSAAAMQLFLMNPQPTPPSPPPGPSSSTHLHLQGFHTSTAGCGAAFGTTPIPPSQFHWGPSTSTNPPQPPGGRKIGGGVENQGLSLTLSTSLQHLEAAKAEEFRMGDDGVFYYDPAYQMKNLGNHNQAMQLQLQGVGHNNQRIGLRPSFGSVSLLRNSKYVKAAQELLEEFCSVERGHQLKNQRSLARQNSKLDPNQGISTSTGGNRSSSSSSGKNPTPLSASDRIDYQRNKTKLLSMLDEVDRRYSHYCEQMHLVVNSFDSIMGFGSATPYTALAQKAMSRHFRCLKDAITTQLKQTCELLGDKDSAGVTGVTKGETPRLKLLEQSLRQQRAFHQMGMMEQEAWRPQRGLPERSVNILRAWLFEHFLHPYPSDADKHLLARQTGLSRNQVSNWFINARVRLWKPMVEEMYQQEAKDEEDGDEDEDEDEDERESNQPNNNTSVTAQTARPTTTQPGSSATTTAAGGQRSEINDMENDPSFNAINTQCFSENQAIQISPTATTFADYGSSCHVNNIIGAGYGTTAETEEMASTLVRFGTTMGDVSLTLGLRHAGNFGGC